MPIYEYKCTSCGKIVEVLQKMGDAPLKKCESCSGRLEKILSRTSFHLSGGGWYSSGYSKGGASPADPSGTSGSKSSGTSESKPSETSGSSGASDGKADSKTDGAKDTKKKDTKKASEGGGGGCGSGCGCH